ncbi:hypothetical protein GRS48_01515 [Halorubrum sp. JWXQ-INN 858]|uniref:hypothetical protein n=1 Tax=Halorubrum sp. JWXQ-INN 858 TaxID=2690782 RepID=UPI00135B5962|nr:hypothetical protein [Halorubrum sp. JWXQ-INN 858]MWV63505.1 hypothetical protein [Halorubrum sp. JWXQ-INN 858]
MSEGRKGVRAGVEESKGDPRLVLLLNAVLSTWFAWTVVWGADLLGLLEYTLTNVATLALLVFALTYVVVLR